MKRKMSMVARAPNCDTVSATKEVLKRRVMAQVEVVIYQKGLEIKRALRPLRLLKGKPYVMYKRKLRPLVEGNKICLESTTAGNGGQSFLTILTAPGSREDQVEVRICREGREIKRIVRPLWKQDGKFFVKYKGRLRPLTDGKCVYLDGVAIRDDIAMSIATCIEGGNSRPTTQATPLNWIEWDNSQRGVIDAPPEDSILVGAGPGTGKTAVACARVARLIEQAGLEPSRIWLISFTRTAVREIRDRISAYLENIETAYTVKIATLDSHAWTIHTGFDRDAKILGAYDENIGKVLELVRIDEDIHEYLHDNVSHLLIDEAQDIVGVRAELVVEMIRKLSSSCGVSVFVDEAQAIYGFTDDKEDQSDEEKQPFTEKVLCEAGRSFRKVELERIHRTKSPQLVSIFSDTRRKVLIPASKTQNKLQEVKDEINQLAHGKAPAVDDLSQEIPKDVFILYRRRSEVLLASSILAKNGKQHRVRMSGLPVCIAPWIGAALAEHTQSSLTKDEFGTFWLQRVHGTPLQTLDFDDAWDSLIRTAGQTRAFVDMRLLRKRLCQQPPAELCHNEIGLDGPVVSTIHSSKGRETDTVHLMLSQANHNNDQDEESRVVFVGATRARSLLLMGSGYWQSAKRVKTSGRAYCLHTKKNKPIAQFEVGRENDITPYGLAGRDCYVDAETVHNAQMRICSYANGSASLIAEMDHTIGYLYRLKEQEHDGCVAVLAENFNYDLFAVGKALQEKLSDGQRRPPNKIPHLHVHGLRTIVLHPDAEEECNRLHEPWRSSGIMLAPLILGYSTTFFPLKKRQNQS